VVDVYKETPLSASIERMNMISPAIDTALYAYTTIYTTIGFYSMMPVALDVSFEARLLVDVDDFV